MYLHSYTGTDGHQTNAENTKTAGVSVAGGGGWARRGVSVVSGAVEPPQDPGRDEEPAQ